MRNSGIPRDKQAFNSGQNGFRKGRSLSHHETLLNSMQWGDNADMIYLDFAHAFDKVDHGILLHKLRKLGIYIWPSGEVDP